MSFLTSPPEIISSLLHAGAGSEPMLAASAAWDGLAAELGSAAQSFSSITSGLAADAWQGPASAAMASTAARYAGVLSAAASQAQTAAAQAQAVAIEFESALAAAVHPALVSANRNQLVQLVFSNLFGQNAPAIAATEAAYEEMWAQDVFAMIGYHGGVSAAATQLPSWSAALQALPAEASAAVANPVGSALSSLSSAATTNPLVGLVGPVPSLNGIVNQVEQVFEGAINFPTEVLFGRPLIGGSTLALGGTSDGRVPLSIVGGTEPVVNATVGSGAPVALLVDTGSTGLVVPFQNAGGLLGVLQLGLPTGFGIGGYSGGIDYLYATFNAPVNFGGGLVTHSTPVDIEFFAWPTSLQSLMNNGLTFQSYFAPDGVSGVLGVGPNAGGPGPSIPTRALPAPFNQGILINETGSSQPPYIQFGTPQSIDLANLGNPIAVLTGAPIPNGGLTVDVIHNGTTTPYPNVGSIIDSGGVDGTLPANISAQPGDLIAVYAGDVPLYSYKLNTDYFPTPVSSGALMNTGAAPFLLHPVYINYGANTQAIY